MAEFSSVITEALTNLTGYIGVDGKLLQNKDALAEQVIGTIKDTLDIDISLEEYTDPDPAIGTYKMVTIDGVAQTSPDMLYDNVNELGESSTMAQYFSDGENVYTGVLSTTGGASLAKALTLATSLNLKYKQDTIDEHVWWVTSQYFKIKIEEATENTPAKIQVSITYGSMYEVFIEPFNSDWCYSTGQLPYIRYYLCKGSTGDCYLKGYYSDDATEINPDTVNEEFADVSMNIFNEFADIDGVSTLQKINSTYGGFAIVGMVYKVTHETTYRENQLKPYEYDYYDSDYSGADAYSIILWKKDGAPIFVSLTGETKNWTKEYSTISWKRIITNAPDQVVALAPLFGPGSGLFGSFNSFWSMVISKDGMYELAVGDGGKFQYDHGFALRMS